MLFNLVFRGLNLLRGTVAQRIIILSLFDITRTVAALNFVSVTDVIVAPVNIYARLTHFGQLNILSFLGVLVSLWNLLIRDRPTL